MTTADTARLIATRDEAQSLLSRIGEAMVALVTLFEQETSLIRAGRLSAAAALAQEKTDLAAGYLRDIEIMKANAPFLRHAVPEEIEELRRAHATFREILSLNLRVIATAQSVAEGIVRGAAEDASRRGAPRAYGADGRTADKPASRPVIVSRAS